MTLFASLTAQEIWIEMNCHQCWQPDEAARREHGKETQCPIQERALRIGRKPVEWKRNTRQTIMAHAYKCNAYQDKPAVSRRDSVDENVPLFEETPYRVDVGFVPVDGWPDYKAIQKKNLEGDHQ